MPPGISTVQRGRYVSKIAVGRRLRRTTLLVAVGVEVADRQAVEVADPEGFGPIGAAT